MTIDDALAPFYDAADKCIVVTTMAACGAWPRKDERPTVFHYVPSSMGQGPALGLGLALACPGRRVLVVNGDGSMLMNLGVLATIAACRPANLVLAVLDNGIYEVTGGQAHAGSHGVDYCGLAQASGIVVTRDFSDSADWRRSGLDVLTESGPVFVRLAVDPRFGEPVPGPRMPMSRQIEQLRLGIGLQQ